MEKGIEMMQRAVELDPLSSRMEGCLGNTYFYSRRWDEAKRSLKRIVDIDSGTLWMAESNLSMVFLYQGLLDSARFHLEQSRQSPGSDPVIYHTKLAFIEASAGRRSQFQREIEALSAHDVGPFTFARVYASAGMKEQAFAKLEESLRKCSNSLVLLNVLPEFNSLRGDPRFDEMIRRTGGFLE